MCWAAFATHLKLDGWVIREDVVSLGGGVDFVEESVEDAWGGLESVDSEASLLQGCKKHTGVSGSDIQLRQRGKESERMKLKSHVRKVRPGSDEPGRPLNVRVVNLRQWRGYFYFAHG